ncbi:MAG: ABC transporter permease [Pseudomonadota bacterium]
MANKDSMENISAPALDLITAPFLKDLFALSWRLVIRNRRRYKFVIIALAVGVAGLVFVVNTGAAVEEKIAAQLTLLGGATIISVERHDFDNPHPGEYHDNDIDTLKVIPHIIKVAPLVSLDNVAAYHNAIELKVRLVGIEGSFAETIMATCREGRFINDDDNKYRAHFCVLGEEVSVGLFGKESPIGKTVSVGNLMLLVVGVLGGIQGSDTRRSIFIPLELARSQFVDMLTIKELRIRVDHWNVVERLTAQIAATLGSAHPGYQSGIRIRYFPERIKRVGDSVKMVKWLSLLTFSVVAGLGCVGAAYLMRSAVKERTKEIGLKKSVGWTDKMILLQFLFESLTVFLLGGSIGVICAVISCLILKFALGFTIQPVLLWTSSVGGMMGLGFCGLVAGFYPAARAASMDPIEAMKFE